MFKERFFQVYNDSSMKSYPLHTRSIHAGFSGIVLLFIIILILIGAFTAYDFGYVAYQERQFVGPTVTPYPGQVRTPVTARGSFKKDKYGVDIVLDFILEGGVVTGSFSGDCKGKISGYYDGKDGGVISGKAFGTCDPFVVPIPATATFSGMVSQKQKTVPINGTGTAAGISGTGSLILSY
jgi:hypothetical protein